jgi:hypothetical protein
MGANDRHPPPHAAEGWPTDNVATVVVGFSPRHPLPCATPSHPPCSRICCPRRICCCRGRRGTGTPPCISHLPPPPPPIPSSSAIERQRKSKRKPQHVQPLVHVQDADRKVGCIIARRRSRASLHISPVVRFDFWRGWHWGRVAVVCAVVVGGGCGCGGGVTRYYLDKNDNFGCHVTFAGRKSSIFEKRTQKYKNFLLHSKVKKISFGFLPPKKPVICYTTVPESLPSVQVVWYNSCNFCWLKNCNF